MMRLTFAGLVALAPSAPAAAQQALAPLHPYCASRPSLGAGACIADAGHPMLEMGVGDWQRDRSDGTTTDTLTGADTLLRIGLGETTEVQFGWTAIGQVRTRAGDGPVERRTRTGDVSLAIRQNLRNPDGSGFSIAVQPFATVPTGRMPVGAGTWGAGMLVPLGYQINDVVQLQFTAEGDAAPDEDGEGRHLAWSGIAGLALTLSDAVTTTTELFVQRDRDPGGHATTLLAAFSGGYQVANDSQVDAGTAIGLNAASPDIRLFFGFSHRF